MICGKLIFPCIFFINPSSEIWSLSLQSHIFAWSWIVSSKVLCTNLWMLYFWDMCEQIPKKTNNLAILLVTFLGWWTPRDPNSMVVKCELKKFWDFPFGHSGLNHLEILWKSYHQHRRPDMWVVHPTVFPGVRRHLECSVHGFFKVPGETAVGKAQRLRKRTDLVAMMMSCP